MTALTPAQFGAQRADLDLAHFAATLATQDAASLAQGRYSDDDRAFLAARLERLQRLASSLRDRHPGATT